MLIKKTILRPNLSEVTQSKKKKYQGMTGSLIFFMIEIRLDINFFITVVVCFVKNKLQL